VFGLLVQSFQRSVKFQKAATIKKLTCIRFMITKMQ
jgi:hypothetical protein